jgi:hypothetical protein
MLKNKIIFYIFLILIPTLAKARWATFEEAPIEYEFFNANISLDQDANSEEIIEYQLKILNEAGREAYGVQRLIANENTSQIEILEAKTIFEGKETLVPKNMIESKPLASDIKGFDQLIQTLISYPQAAVGSQLYLKYKMKITAHAAPGYYANELSFGQDGIWKKSSINFESALPFYKLINDPNKLLNIKETSKTKDNKKLYSISINLKKPIYQASLNESYQRIDNTLKTWVAVSTFNDFNKLASSISEPYEAILNKVLPAELEAIKQKAVNIPDEIDQINKVTSSLAEKLRYMGDWRTINGQFIPRELSLIASSGVGDCKDFSASTVAILRGLGYQANVAIVMRAFPYLVPKKTLASFNNFNHAIVKVSTKAGKTLWIDPTNFASMAGGIFYDISNRPALVLDIKQASYEQIPAVDHRHSKIVINESLDLKNDTLVSVHGKAELIGEQALDLTGISLIHSEQAIEEGLLLSLSGEASPPKSKITLPSLKSRITKDLIINYSYEQENNRILTNAGSAISLNANWADPLLRSFNDQVGSTFISEPKTSTKKIVINNVRALNLESLNYSFQSHWINASRNCYQKDTHIIIEENIEFLKSFISAEELRSEIYKDLKKNIKKYCKNVAVLVSKQE